MGKNSYKAQLNYYDSKWGWKSEGTASQGQWDGTGVRTGVLYFPGLAALKGKIINSVKLTATTGQTGYGTATTKTVYIYNSASQGGIKTSLNAGHRTGNALGSCKAPMWDNTKTFDAAFMAASIAAGYDTYCIYNGSSYTDYLKWTAVTLEVDWQEPATQPSLSVSTVEMGKSVTISTPAVNSAYRHTLRYVFGKATGTIAENVASSKSWTPPVSLANQIPSATAGSGTIYCDTYSGSTLLGTKSVSITLTVPGSVVPSAGTLSAALAEDTSGTGLYVKGMGKADAFGSIRRIRQQHHLVHDHRRRMDGHKRRTDNRHAGLGRQHHVHGHGDGFARTESQHYAHNQRHRLHKAPRSGV